MAVIVKNYMKFILKIIMVFVPITTSGSMVGRQKKEGIMQDHSLLK